MGAVKTTKRRKAELISLGDTKNIALVERKIKYFDRRWNEKYGQSNNRRKMAGLPLIRRAKP